MSQTLSIDMTARMDSQNASQSDFDSDLQLDPYIGDEASKRELRIKILIQASLYANCILFAVKLYASIMSRSLAVMGSTLDSFLDLLTQVVIYGVERCSRHRDRTQYPAGLSRLEPIGVILCASFMGMASLELIFHSVMQLLSGYHKLWFSILSITILVTAIVLKIILYIFCSAQSKYSGSLLALAEDHRNDVMTNTMALATGFTAHLYPTVWWMDPLGAILMSIYIAISWFFIAKEQVEMLVGRSADPQLVEKLRNIAKGFHKEMKLDIIRVYHFGTRFLVELEMVLPKDKTVKWAHDRSLKLQKLLEQQEDVERAYVHCDYKARQYDEHDWEMIRQNFQEKSKRLRDVYYSYQNPSCEEESHLITPQEVKVELDQHRHKGDRDEQFFSQEEEAAKTKSWKKRRNAKLPQGELKAVPVAVRLSSPVMKRSQEKER